VIAYIDGGARGNPGPAGFGVRIERPDGTLVEEFSESIGIATNNVAEYRGLLAALEWAKRHGERELLVRSDSLLLVQQMKGVYKVKNEGLQPLHARARVLAHDIGRVSYEHVRREQNAHADRLANVAMDGASDPSGNAPRRSAPRDDASAVDPHPFSPLERTVRLHIYRHFVETAGAPDVAAIGKAVDANRKQVDAALRALADAHAIVLAPSTLSVWMAHPFSAVPTAYAVDTHGRRYFANCEWDALGILSLLGDGDARTRCEDCGDEIAFSVRGGQVRGSGVIHFAVPPRRFWDNVAFT